ncbi:TM0106 family RecB-like putative nuclease [Pseudonocardia broussonetiae]|uniref:TM0106 family RecB-like putative nuclease n=1 Tax=Pseudonocardia broussonetiae TaxID=2736640 RepID=A0A6M6JF15_9PSEU|nr:TM0106 family RecB-like putative nuclease [Pseudonocardia broussonetiae]
MTISGGRQSRRLSEVLITLGGVTATARTPSPPAVLLDAGSLTRCRRRIHLDHDPSAAGVPQALPDPSLEQRRADAAAHRDELAARLGAVLDGWERVPAGGTAERVAATAAAVERGAPYVWGAVLPSDGAGRGGAELLVRLPGGGYVPLVVVRHRVTDPGTGAVTSPLLAPHPDRALPDPARKVRSQPRDLLRLAHLHRLLRAAGWAPPDAARHAHLAGVIGLDADAVVWHDLRSGHWPGGRSTLAEYEARFADRTAVARAAATGAPALAAPSRVNECRHCPWWPTCEAELRRTDDVSLVVRGETAVALREVGVQTVEQLAGLDPTAEPPIPFPAQPYPDVVALARAWRKDLSVVRRVPRVPVLRADVEVDVDMESFGESGAYLWGALLTHPGGARPGDEPDGYRAFATWDPVPTLDEARSFAAFWGWLSAVRARAAASGRTFAAYCYNEQAENRWLLGSAQRFAGMPGIPPIAEVEAFIADPCWVDLFAVVNEWFLCAHGKGLKRIAPAAGFGWHDAEASGENSMRWYRDAVGMDGAPPDPVQRERLLEYNADDVAATHAVRVWMTSPAIDDVPLAADL